MPRLLSALLVLTSLSLVVLAGDDPQAAAAALAKKLAATATLTDLSIKPLIAADEAVRKEFFKSLGGSKINENNRITLSAYFAKKDPSDDVRFAAAEGLLKAKDNKFALKTLGDLLADKTPALRKAACLGLIGVRGDPTLGPKFAKLLNDADPEVRQAAARAIGKLGDRTQTPAVLAAYKKHKTGGDEDAFLGEALANMGEVDISLEIAKTCLKSRDLQTRIAAANIVECNPSMKVIPLIMENLVLELRRTTTLDPKKADWDIVYVTMCSELIRRTGTNYGNDAAGWYKWWDGVRLKYNAPAPAFDAAIVARWMETYRKMGPSKLKE